MEIEIYVPPPPPKYVGTAREPKYITKHAMYALYPYKWLLINDPVSRTNNGEIVGGELIGAYNTRATAHENGCVFHYRAVINSIQEEI